MIITSIQELRLASPAHALDSIDGLVGFIDNSEHDFLEDKLGTPLYEALCQWYNQNSITHNNVSDYQTGYWNRLLLLAQRVVAFDALGRAIGMQAISVNNAGINQMIADDYPAPDKNGKTIDLYRETCNKEAHASLNQLLRQLEQWCKKVHHARSSSSNSSEDGVDNHRKNYGAEDDSIIEMEEIVALWYHSRYYYLSTELLIPTCEVLQQYLNVYDSREKFIQMLPDLQFVQEEQIAPSVGETLMSALVRYAVDSAVPDDVKSDVAPVFDTILHRLRKVMAALLAGRTSVLKYSKEQKVQFHDDGVRMFETAINELRAHQNDIPEILVKDSPWYVAPPEPAAAPNPSASTGICHCPCPDKIKGAALWTSPLL